MEVKSPFLEALASHQVVVVAGSTGCGKTTQLPQFLLSSGLVKGGIVCTQPRRIAAISAAHRVAEERKSELGDEVGYHIRFENNTGRNTRLTFMTGGILLREAINDQFLSRYGCVMVDEAHERDMFSDFLLGYLKHVCDRRPEFKVIVSSATMRHEEFLNYFPNSCLIPVEKREFPVSVMYNPAEGPDISLKIELTVRGIHELYQKFGGNRDALVFLPGERDIKYVLERLQKLQLEKLECLPLFGRLAPHEQRRAFAPYDGMKVILATNVAESSLTIDGMRYVIDAGLAKAEGFDSKLGVETLRIGKISKAEAIQRAGRVGRTSPGTCIRLYDERDFSERAEYPSPAIIRSDLTELVFAVKSLGFDRSFDFITRPSVSSWDLAEQKLREFGAIDEVGSVTVHGTQMQKLTVDPQLAHFILGATHYGCVEEAVIMSAMLSIGRFFVSDLYDEPELERAKEKFRDPESDFFTLLNLWDDYQAAGYGDAWCEANHLNPYWMRGVRTIRDQLRDTILREGFAPTSNRNRDAMGKAIFAGFRRNLLRYRKGANYEGGNGLSRVAIFKDSAAANAHPDYVVSCSIRRTGRIYAHCIHPIPEEWLQEADTVLMLLPSETETQPQTTPTAEGTLIDAFLKQPISELGLSDALQLKLLGIGVEVVGDLTSRSESQLQKETATLLGKTLGKDLQQVKDRLRYFDLELAPEKTERRGFAFDNKVINLPVATPLNDEQAARVLGEQFPLFQAFRLAAQEYRAQGGMNGTRENMHGARNAIVAKNVRLAMQRARMNFSALERLRDPSMDFEDLYQEGCIGLLAAVERFDYARGFRFSTYAYQWIRQAVGRFLDDNSGMPVHIVTKLKKFSRLRQEAADRLGYNPNREELAEILGKPVGEIEQLLTLCAFWMHTSLDEPLTNNNSYKGSEETTLKDYLPAPEASLSEQMEKAELQGMVSRILDETPFLEAERQCLELYFGLNGNQPCTLEEIGERMGVTRERVRQRLEESLKRLRTPRIWEMARQHIKTLPAPSTQKTAKFETSVGDTVNDIVRVRVAEESPSNPEPPTEEVNLSELRWKAMAIMTTVAEHYGVSSEELFGPSRAGKIARARQVGMYRLREELHMSFPQIGEIFNRDHSTAIHGYRLIASEVLSGIIPLGCFPPAPRVAAAAAASHNHNGQAAPVTNKHISTNDVLDQDIEVLGLSPKIERILRTKRKAKTLRNLQDIGRDRLLMTSDLHGNSVEEIEAALMKQGIQLAP